MDPLSITASALAILAGIAKVKALAKFAADTDVVNEQLNNLVEEIYSLSTLVEDVKKTSELPVFQAAVQAVEKESNTRVTDSLGRSLDHCKGSVEKLGQILSVFEPGKNTNVLRKGVAQYRLSNRAEDIQRVQGQIQSHKLNIQLSLTNINACASMQSDQQGAVQSRQLLAMLENLEKKMSASLEEIQRRIGITQGLSPGDVEQTQILEDLELVRETSVKIKRAVTMELQRITLSTLSEQTEDSASFVASPSPGSNPASPFGIPRVPVPVVEQAQLGKAIEDLRPSHNRSASLRQAARPSPSGVSRSGSLRGPPEISRPNPFARKSDPPQQQSPLSQSRQWSNPYPMSSQSSLGLPDALKKPAIQEVKEPIDAFDDEMNTLINRAEAQTVGKERSFSEDDIAAVSQLLQSIGKTTWSQRPRTYLVLRMIGEEKRMNDFVVEGFKDIDIPYASSTLPAFLSSQASREKFLMKQRAVLSSKTADLVKGGPHRHLGSADSYFVSIRELGKGGHGKVDEVQNKSDLRSYARKRIDRPKTFAKKGNILKQYENEVHNLKRLQHKHLVKFVGSYTDPKHVGIIMEPVANTDLRNFLHRNNFTEDDINDLNGFIGCLTEAVVYLHENSCRHKDLKPANVLIKDNTVLIADFGLALDWTELNRETTTGKPDGFTHAYMAPEVARAEDRNTASDIWSLGCIFLEILTVLCGKTLADKVEFFELHGTRPGSYWQNKEHLDEWLDVLANQTTDHHDALMWTQVMTDISTEERPTANKLQEHINRAQESGRNYFGACCNDQVASEDSYQASDSDEGETMTSMMGPESDTHATTVSNPLMRESSPGTGDSGQWSPLVGSPGPSHKKPKIPLFDWQEPTSRSEATELVDRSIPPQTPQVLSQTQSQLPLKIPALSPPQVLSRVPFDAAPQSPPIPPKIPHVPADTTSSLPESIAGASMKDALIGLSKSEGKKEEAKDDSKTDDSKQLARHHGGGHHDVGHTTHGLDSHIPENEITEEIVRNDLPDSAADELRIQVSFETSLSSFELLLTDLKAKGDGWKESMRKAIRLLKTDTKGHGVLHQAAKFVDEALARETIEIAVQQSADVDKVNLFQNTPIHYAANLRRPAIVQSLLDAGAKVDLVNLRKQTPLHVAVRAQDVSTVKILLKADSSESLNAKDDYGKTPLHIACSTLFASVEVVRAILDHGPAVEVTDDAGKTPLQYSYAAFSPEISVELEMYLGMPGLGRYSSLPGEMPPFPPMPGMPPGLGPYGSSMSLPYGMPPYPTPTTLSKPGEPCKCENCKLIEVVKPVTETALPKYLNCTCMQHLLIFADDTLSDTELVRTTLLDCTCTQCEKSNKEWPSLPPFPSFGGLPGCNCSICKSMNKDYGLPPMPGMPGDPFGPGMPGDPFGPLSLPGDPSSATMAEYLGDEYYDMQISMDIPPGCDCEKCKSNIKYDGMASLSSAGFKGKTSYRANPDKPWIWAMNNIATLVNIENIVTVLLDSGAKPDTLDSKKCTMLHLAARFGKVKLAQALIKRGARIDTPRYSAFAAKDGFTPLLYALWNHQLVMARLLIKEGADINVQPNFTKQTILHMSIEQYAVLYDLVPMILASGARMDTRDEHLNTPLHFSVKYGNVAVTSKLLEMGADVEAVNKTGQKPLAMAIELGSTEITRLLVKKGADVHGTCGLVPCALTLSVQKGYGGVVKALLEDSTAKSDVNRKDLQGRTPLHLLATAPAVETITILALLVEYGADINAENRSAQTPLHEAARAGSVLMVNQLLVAGAFEHAQNTAGKTPLDLAQDNRHKEVVELLGGTLKKKRWFR